MRARGPVCRISSVVMLTSLRSPEPDPHARRQQRRIGPIDIPQHRIGVADQLPSAGGATRVDSGEFAGQAHRAGWDRWAWLGPSRDGQTRVAADLLIWTTESDKDQADLLANPDVAELRSRSMFTTKDQAGAIAYASPLSYPLVADQLPPLIATILH